MRRHTAQVVDEDDFDSRASPVCYMDLSSYYSALEQVNTSTSNGPLTIAIVGAGIGGLAVAIGLRRNGHNVQVYDKSRLANDFGAAVHLCPNASGILRRWGIRAETFGANPMSRFVERAKDGQTRKDIDLVEANKRWAHPWHLVHRVALHEELKRIATSEESAGVPVRLLTSSNVVAVDPEKGATTLENGTTVTSDVVVGADGIYSLTRKYIKDVKLLSTGKAALGFMIPRSEAEADTTTAPLVSQRDSLTMWCGDDRRVVMYPCDNNQLLNFVCIHPENESHHAVLSDEWNKQASIDQVLKVYEDFDPRLKALISKADPSTIKVWQLPDMEKLPAWTSGKLVLLGDAAHPFTPHQAQGAAQAIEDAAALSTVLPQSTARDEIPARLKLYESIRYERAHRIQHYSRMAGQDWADGKPPVDAMEFQTYNFDHDEIAHASAALQQWESSRAPKSAGSGTGL